MLKIRAQRKWSPVSCLLMRWPHCLSLLGLDGVGLLKQLFVASGQIIDQIIEAILCYLLGEAIAIVDDEADAIHIHIINTPNTALVLQIEDHRHNGAVGDMNF